MKKALTATAIFLGVLAVVALTAALWLAGLVGGGALIGNTLGDNWYAMAAGAIYGFSYMLASIACGFYVWEEL